MGAPGGVAVLDSYLVHLRRRNFSPMTIDNYRVCLSVWFRWCIAEGVTGPVAGDVEEFLDSRCFQPSSRHHYLSTIKVFYKWAVENGWETDNPAAKIASPKLPESLPRPLSEEDLERALSNAPDDLAAMMQLAARAGLRCKEIAGIHSRDLHFDREPPMLTVAETKGDRQRQVPLHPKIMEALLVFGVPADGFVFPGFLFDPNRRGGDHSIHVRASTVSKKGNRYLRSCGIDATMHQLRHRFGTMFYQKTLDAVLTQRMMGHKSIASTMIYTMPNLANAVAGINMI